MVFIAEISLVSVGSKLFSVMILRDTVDKVLREEQ